MFLRKGFWPPRSTPRDRTLVDPLPCHVRVLCNIWSLSAGRLGLSPPRTLTLTSRLPINSPRRFNQSGSSQGYPPRSPHLPLHTPPPLPLPFRDLAFDPTSFSYIASSYHPLLTTPFRFAAIPFNTLPHCPFPLVPPPQPVLVTVHFLRLLSPFLQLFFSFLAFNPIFRSVPSGLLGR